MTEQRTPRLLLAAALIAAPLLFAGCVSSQIPSEGSQGTSQTQSTSDPDDDATTEPDDDATTEPDDDATNDAGTDSDDNTSSAARPSVEEIADGFEVIMESVGAGGAYTRDQAICISEVLWSSEISDEDLANIADGIDIQTSVEARDLVSEVTMEAVETCLPG